MNCVDCGRSSKEVTLSKYRAGFLCLKCYFKNRGKNPNPFPSSYYVEYKKSRILAPYQLRDGLCRICRNIGKLRDGRVRTHSHHYLYDDMKPYANTIEMCIRCHLKITRKKLVLIKPLIPMITANGKNSLNSI